MSDVRVKFLDLTRHYPAIKSKVMPVFEEILDSQFLLMGPHVTELEKNLEKWTGVKHAICCDSGTDALIIGLMALGVGPGDEVITPAFSFMASTTSIMLVGAKPVFVDIDPQTFNLDPEAVKSAITDKTKAIMPVHLFGQCADMKSIMAIARENKLSVIEDNAQSMGATCSEGPSGGIGDLGAVSFYPTKNLGGAGDAGMVMTNNDDLADTLRINRSHGERRRYYHEVLGTNSRMDALQGAFLNAKLPLLNSYMEKRAANAKNYIEGLRDLEDKGLVLPHIAEGNTHIWNQFVIRVPDRDRVAKDLNERGVQTAVYYPVPVTDHPITQALGAGKEWPEARRACAEVLALPIYPELSPEEHSIVIEELHQVL